MKFYKWANSLRDEYEAFKKGDGSMVLNDERVLNIIC
jgi:hypothetical protein